MSLTASTTPHAFIYRNGTMTPLGASLGGTQSVANDLNEAGQVVGRASRAGDTSFRAFLFAGGGVRPRLKTPKCKMH